MTRLDLLVNALVPEGMSRENKDIAKRIVIAYLKRRDNAATGEVRDHMAIQYLEDAKNFDTVESL